jgi:hypothetical protein
MNASEVRNQLSLFLGLGEVVVVAIEGCRAELQDYLTVRTFKCIFLATCALA